MGKRENLPRQSRRNDIEDSYRTLTDYVVFDLETNGLQHNSAILEVGAVKISNGIITDKFKSYAYTEDKFNGFAARVHNIDKRDIRKAPQLDAVLGEFMDFTEDTVLIAHNATGFDSKVLNYHVGTHGIPWSPEYLDSLDLAKAVLPDNDKYTLESLIGQYQILHQDIPLHRAYTDAWLLSHVVSHLRVEQGFMLDGEYGLFLDSWNNYFPEEEASTPINMGKEVEAIFKGAHVAITGEFEDYKKEDLIDAIKSLGGAYQKGVTRKTTLLLSADGKYNFITGEKQESTNKEKRAQELIEKGQELSIISESELVKLLSM